MNVIKIFLAESGSVAELRKDFPLYQDAFQNKLLNVYVPTGIVMPFLETQTQIEEITSAVVQAFTAVKIGCVSTQRNGKLTQTPTYFMRWLKKVVVGGVEYFLYERKLPRAFTLVSGEGGNAPRLTINVVNIQNEVIETLEGQDFGGPKVIEIITSQQCVLEVNPSKYLDAEPPLEPSELELINGQLDAHSIAIDALNNEVSALDARIDATQGEWLADINAHNTSPAAHEDIRQDIVGAEAAARDYTDFRINNITLPDFYQGQKDTLDEVLALPTEGLHVGSFFYVLNLGVDYEGRSGNATWNGTDWDISPDNFNEVDNDTIIRDPVTQLIEVNPNLVSAIGAAADALANKVNWADVGAPYGVAPLDGNGKVPAANLDITTQAEPDIQPIVWSGTVGDFSYTRTAAEHGKGITPQVQCYRDNVQIDCEALVDLNGDVTVYSNADISGMIIEIR